MVKRLESEYREKGLRTAGFISEAEYHDGQKSSYYLRDIETGDRILSVVENIPPDFPDHEEFFRIGLSRFYFYKPSFEVASGRIAEILNSGAADIPDVVFIDEIGPLELSGQGHYQAVKKLIAGYEGMLMMVIREGLLDGFLDKLGLNTSDVEFLRTDPKGREDT